MKRMIRLAAALFILCAMTGCVTKAKCQQGMLEYYNLVPEDETLREKRQREKAEHKRQQLNQNHSAENDEASPQ